MDEMDAELERRLTLLDEPGGGGMLQADLPLLDVGLLGLVIVVVSVALLMWVV